MNTECTIGREPGHCLWGMLTPSAEGQFRLHSSNCWRTQKLQEPQTDGNPRPIHPSLPGMGIGATGLLPFQSFP